MPDVKISALPSGTANAAAVVPATNAAGTTTQKVTLGSIRDLPHTHAIVDITGLQTALDGKQASGSYAAATHASTHQTGGADAIPNVVTSPAQLTADQNNYNPGTGDIFRLDASAARNITGVVAGTNGQAILLVNTGSHAITLRHQSTSSTEANRLVVPWAGDYVMAANGGAALLIYFTALSRWRVI
jgi:hypothetical protein